MTGMSEYQTIEDETCVLCSEKVTYCGCLRCQECEQLFEESEDPEVDCPHCGGEPY